MYLENLTLRNFKCFAEQSLRFSKITILLGANSSGKSSLLQGLLAAVQTDRFPFALSTNGMFADLGDFKSLVARHDVRQDVGISLKFGNRNEGPLSIAATFRRSRKGTMPELVSAETADPGFSLKITRKAGYRVAWRYDVGGDSFRRALGGSSEVQDVLNRLAKIIFTATPLSPRARRLTAEDIEKKITNLPPTSGSFTVPAPEAIARNLQRRLHFTLAPHVSAQLSAIVAFRGSFNFVGPFRIEPQRSYFQVSKGDLKVLRDGQNSIEQIMNWQESSPTKLRQLVNAYSQLGLLSQVHAGSLQSGLFEVRVRAKSSKVPASLPDVGFGIGQVMPILVAEIQLPEGGTLAVSQPETHLHPSAQADLADHFVRGISSRGLRYIVETHSEYFLNRLRLLVAQKKLKTDDISVVFLKNDGAAVKLSNIQFLPDGRIEGAPDDFFKTYMIDVMNIALSANKR